eukprot:10332035-Alexandrium_andersonii.AAC.1
MNKRHSACTCRHAECCSRIHCLSTLSMPLGTLCTRCICRSRPPASPPDYAILDAATCTNAAPTFTGRAS